MSVVETLLNIANSNLIAFPFKYCFVTQDKRPFRVDGLDARSNVLTDFVSFDELIESTFVYRKRTKGIGISIQASNVCAIDVDDCFVDAFDITSIDERGQNILELFENIAYCEFSFSGHGLRILFLHDIIDNYEREYYIKNSTQKVEFYQPSNSNRFVTVTGRYIRNNAIKSSTQIDNAVQQFLNTYMIRPITSKNICATNEFDLDACMKVVKRMYLTNSKFQSLWFGQAPGSGKNESEMDFQLLAMIYENVTTDKATIRLLFESSPYFQSKDEYHVKKWTQNNNRYFDYIYSHFER